MEICQTYLSLLVVLELNRGTFFADLIPSGGTLKLGTNPLLLNKAIQLKDGMLTAFLTSRILSQVVILFHGKFLLQSLTCHGRTYCLISNALCSLPVNPFCCSHSSCSAQLRWPDSTPLHLVKVKYIYSLLSASSDIVNHAKSIWDFDLDLRAWKRCFSQLWRRPIEPKVNCFLWRVFLHKLPFIKLGEHTPNCCSVCSMAESAPHVFFECSFARHVRYSFGLVSYLCILIAI